MVLAHAALAEAMTAEAEQLREPGLSAWLELLPALESLDRRLQAAVRNARAAFAPAAAGEEFRGLFVSETDAENMLARDPGEPLLFGGPAGVDHQSSRLARLQRAFGLTSFDVEVVLLTLAPELDRRYERLYGYLQDNVNQRRPTVDLALHLLCPDAAARIEQRQRFSETAPLVGAAIVQLSGDADSDPLLTRDLKLAEQVVSFLLRQDRPSSRLAACCRASGPPLPLDELALDGRTAAALLSLLGASLAQSRDLRLHLQGPPGCGQLEAACSLAAALGRQTIALDLGLALQDGDPERLLRLLDQACRLWGALPCLLDAGLLSERSAATERLAQQVEGLQVPVFLIGEAPRPAYPEETVAVPFGTLTFQQARRAWRGSLERRGLQLADGALDELAGRLQLRWEELEAAVEVALGEHRLVSGELGAGVSVEDLYRAAGRETTNELESLARRVRPAASWDDIVLPSETLYQLRELCVRVTRRRRVMEEWGFGERLSLGRGTVALFSGPPGSGKTLAAEVIARELKLELYRIDLSTVVSKYIGETEKNLSRIFAAAERSNAILFFDEADALFGKRSEVHDSHDRYANVEISYLLQELEEYEGVAILATNLRQNLDESFLRRFAFTVHFPFPDEAGRLEIWRRVWPARTPLAPDVDLPLLARELRLAGGNIRNIALAAAFLAAEQGAGVTLEHLRHASRREFQKLGKVLREADAGLPAVATNGSAAR